jgi:hypothetical protein
MHFDIDYDEIMIKQLEEVTSLLNISQGSKIEILNSMQKYVRGLSRNDLVELIQKLIED